MSVTERLSCPDHYFTVSRLLQKNNDAVTPSSTAATDVRMVLINGSWPVENYQQKIENKTDNFAGASLVFSDDGSVAVTQGSKTIKGRRHRDRDTLLRQKKFELGLEQVALD